ncbi:MAG TPA: ABC transporter permease, partial [Ramlibacter sp.]|nr:ABC transporter permease [Ramlibacter sp.]
MKVETTWHGGGGAASAPQPAPAPAARPPVKSFWSHAAYVLSDNPFTLVAAVLFAVFVLMAIVGPWVVPYDPLATNVGPSLSPPTAKNWFGTDSLGRDIFSRVVAATRIDFVIALSAVAASFVVGGLLGACAGYFGGWLERVVMRGCDMVMSFPLFVLAMGIVAAMGNSVLNIILATAVVNLPFYIRVARTEVNVRRDAGFVEAARLAGNGDARILLLHLVPNALPPMMVQISL